VSIQIYDGESNEGDMMQPETARSTALGRDINAVLDTLLVGNSPRMLIVRAMIAKLANSSSTVLITGESGTGKELAARAIHQLSPRREQAFVPVNCAAIPEELLESELFGHVRGAFTGALNARQGRFQLAHGGTLFLDEIGDMSPKLQVKLLRVLQEREFEPVGSDHPVQVDVRVVTATNRDLRVAVQEGKFREDLFYRLNVLPLELPPLREREGDVVLLIQHFLKLHGRRKGREALRVEAAAMGALEKYRWPGNVREIENLIERLVVMTDEAGIGRADLPDYVVNNALPQHYKATPAALPEKGLDLDDVLERIENGYIQQALEKSRGNKTIAAELLNLNRTTFIERLRKKGMLHTARNNNAKVESAEKLTPNNFPLTQPSHWNEEPLGRTDAEKTALSAF
jgi:transcriptional regulator with PAS, ATPase and Fis domain